MKGVIVQGLGGIGGKPAGDKGWKYRDGRENSRMTLGQNY